MSPEHVLTSAHCVPTAAHTGFPPGAVVVRYMNGDGLPVEATVESFEVHPDFDPDALESLAVAVAKLNSTASTLRPNKCVRKI